MVALTILEGDCIERMREVPEDSVDAVVTDPPYHLASIVKRFGADGATPAASGVYSRSSAGFMGKQWDGGDIAFQPETWAEVLRVLKPGGYLLAFASSRGFCRMGVAIEDAGFIPHPMQAYIFGTGFPKATRIDAPGYGGRRYGGQSLKPAIEPIFMGQKPFSEKTGTANILRWGTGAVNIDACRVPITDGTTTLGRWPANLITDGSPEVAACFPQSGTASDRPTNRQGEATAITRYKDKGSTNFAAQPGQRHNDDGSAARFFNTCPPDVAPLFYTSKAGKADRAGSNHPTVKPLSLMRHLVKLVTPPGGIVLDPFAGSGTTGQAALELGFDAILIEREVEYLADIRRRLAAWLPDELEWDLFA